MLQSVYRKCLIISLGDSLELETDGKLGHKERFLVSSLIAERGNDLTAKTDGDSVPGTKAPAPSDIRFHEQAVLEFHSALILIVKSVHISSLETDHRCALLIPKVRMEVQESLSKRRVLRPVREYVTTYSGTQVNIAIEHIAVGCLGTQPDHKVICDRDTSFVTSRPVVILCRRADERHDNQYSRKQDFAKMIHKIKVN